MDPPESSDGNKIKKVKLDKQAIEYTVKCDWKDCQCDSLSKYEFYLHISKHVRDVEINVDESEEEYYSCLWSSCSYDSKDSKEIVRHIKYHAYLSGLKALGKAVSEILELPPCLITSEHHVINNVGDDPYICSWDDCDISSVGIQEFIDHVHYHIKVMDKKKLMKCLWTDCESAFQIRARLADHIKTHTKEHFVACPNCGHTFANKTKFSDHCLTQKPLEEHTFQCDYCLSLHPTERILRKHMGQHIHHYKCPFCNMTCNKPSLVCKHIRNRHLDYKSFKCSSCTYQCKSKHDLKIHLMSHVKGFQSCLESGCSYTTTSQLALKRHYEQKHVPGRQYGPFVCHICESKFTRGAFLTKHLFKKHNIKKPPGYSRFLYKIDGDGYRRLQTVRLESIDVNEMSELDEIENELRIACALSISSNKSM
ncbi:histone H4 transcription factor [Halyomorpha halys]|uniref:histone H4 transcription factor n=1 Tax=Halyomorpha halys TaxID=286706 RepID=UPI0034D2CBC4